MISLGKGVVDGSFGIITSGVSFGYVTEAVRALAGLAPDTGRIPILKIGTPYPFPDDLALEFAKTKERILVVEEQDPLIEDTICALLHRAHIRSEVFGKRTGHLPYAGEYGTESVSEAIVDTGLVRIKNRYEGSVQVNETAAETAEDISGLLPVRPPVFCAGCPHRASFYMFKEAAKGKDAVFTGDIGCYTLGNAPPLSVLDTCLCMGAGVTIAMGLEKVEPHRPHVGFVGDSTFFHSCMTGLANAVYNKSNITLVVLDNDTTAMTGHQPHPGIGVKADGNAGKKIDIAAVCRAMGVEYVREVSPYDYDAFKQTATAAISFDGPAVIVSKAPCVAKIKKPGTRMTIDSSKCKHCGICVEKLGCPAMSRPENGTPIVDDTCRSCGLCAHICPFDAIREVKSA